MLTWAQGSPDPAIRAALPPGVHAILRSLDDPEPMVRISVLQRLRRIRLERAAIARAVMGLIDRDGQPQHVRHVALSCLDQQIRSPDPTDELHDLRGDMLAALIKALDDPDDKSRRFAVGTLTRLGPRAQPALERVRRLAAEDRFADIRALAERAALAIAARDEELPVAAEGESP